MSKHLYNTTIGKVPWFVKRFGAREIVLKPLRVLFAPLIIPTLPRKTFLFQEQTLVCFYHGYNMTWASERCVEVPIARAYLERYQGRPVLEVGNVLSHYGLVAHDVLDKFEKGPGIINEDIIGFHPAKRYDLILSISTFEHIGFDDEANEPSGRKILRAIASCRQLLGPDGSLVLTVPIGYNPELNLLVRDNLLPTNQQTFLRRVGRLDWEVCRKEEALPCQYRRPFPYANAIMVAEFGPPTSAA
ncbi:MAG TPA: hypothetical protein VI136_24510 [Verrucomicrobiae bacterium]